MRIKIYLAVVCSYLIASFNLSAQTQYIGPSDGDWSNPVNWNNGLPANGNDALIGGGASVSINNVLNIDFTITNYGSITINSTLTNAGTLSNSGALIVTGFAGLFNQGVFNNYGNTNFGTSATFDNEAGAAFTNSGSFSIQTLLTNKGSLTNNGTINASNGTLQTEGTFINNQSLTTESLTVLGGSSFTNNFGSNLIITGPDAELKIDGSFNNLGILIAEGHFILNGNISNSSSVSILGTLVINSSANFNNAGGVVENHGFVTNHGVLTNGFHFKNIGDFENFGQLNNNNLIEIQASSLFSNKTGGSISMGFGSKILNDGEVTNGASLDSYGTIDNNNIFDNNGAINSYSGSKINNYGSFTNTGNINSNDRVTNDQTFHNLGNININAGSEWFNNVTMTNGISGSIYCVQDFHNLGNFTNNGQYRNLVRTSNAGNFINNAFLNNSGDITNKSDGELTNNELLMQEAGNILNLGQLNNSNWLLSDECSSISNDGDISNSGNLEIHALVFQRGTMNGDAVNCQGCYIHTNANSEAPTLCANSSFGADIEGEVKVYATALVAFENFDSCANIIYLANDEVRPLFDCSDIGNTINVDLVVRTRLNDSLTCTAIVTPEDILEPQFENCPTDKVVYTPDASVSIDWAAPVFSDNCTPVTVTESHTSGDNFPVGITAVSYTGSDDYGNSNSCQFRVDVKQSPQSVNCNNDSSAPTFLNCPADISVATTGFSTNVAWVAPIAQDNCYPLTINGSHSPGYSFQVGTTTVSYTAIDGNGNEGNCSFDIIVNNLDLCVADVTAPALNNCPSNIYLPANPVTNSAVAIWSSPNVYDLCGVASINATHASGEVFSAGETTVTYSAIDLFGNTSSCNFIVTVGDDPCPNNSESPVFAGCPNDIVVHSNDLMEIVSWNEPTATSSCGSVTLNSNYQPGDVFQTGTTKITYTASDEKGNVSFCSFNVVILNDCSIDNESPVISNCPVNMEVASEGGSADVSWNLPTATDNCGLIAFSSSFLPGAIFPEGITTVVYTALDISGNLASCEFNIKVVDVSGCTSNASPINLSTGIDPSSVSLSWNAAANASSYDVVLGTSNPPTLVIESNIGGTSTTITGLQGNTIYYWYVVPKNVAGEAVGCESSVTQFSTIGGSSGSDCNLTALFVASSTNLNYSDATVKARLEFLGFDVKVENDNYVSTSDADGMGLIVISSTSVSTNISSKFRDVQVPVINYEGWLHDDFRMTGYSTNYDYGSEGNEYYVNIVDSSHPIAAGLSGNVVVFDNYNSLTWGAPNPDAIIAKVPGSSSKAAIFAYDTGDQMVGYTAPARRVGFFLHNDNADNLTADGFALFDAAVRWAVDMQTPGSTCNDGDPTTVDDVVLEDGCTCAGIPCTGEIQELVFFDIETGNALPISNGESYFLGELPSLFNIEVYVNGEVESVLFEISGDASDSHVENYAPYQFGGDNNPLNLPPGDYKVKATLYSEDHTGGYSCDQLTVSFTLLEGNPVPSGYKLLQSGEITFEQANGSTWYFIPFEYPFDEVPVVVVGPPSANSTEQVIPRIKSVGKNGFEFQMDEWNYLNGYHPFETMYYLAMLPGTYEIDGVGVEAGIVQENSSWSTHYFNSPFSSTPVLLHTVASNNDNDAVAPRARNVNNNGFQLKLQEEDNGNHSTENVNYIAIGEGSFQHNGLTFITGITSNSVRHYWYNIDFPKALANPGFLANFHTYDGGDVCALRHQNLTNSNVEVRVEEEQSIDSEMNHTTEVVGWLVFGKNTTQGLVLNSEPEIILEAVKGEEHTELFWVHNQGELVEHYILERSVDGQSFETISSISSKGGADNEMYLGYDFSPLTGNNFYKIKMEKTDGSVEYSETILVHFTDIVDFELFPNPANDFVKINLEKVIGSEDVTIELFNNLGIQMKKIEIDKVWSKYYQLDIRELHEGSYIIWLNVPERRPLAKQLIVGKK